MPSTVQVRPVEGCRVALQVYGPQEDVVTLVLRLCEEVVRRFPDDPGDDDEEGGGGGDFLGDSLGDSLAVSLRFVLKEQRQSILVCIRAGAPRLVVVFAASDFRCPFEVVLGDGDDGRSKIPRSSWWSSQGIACNVPSSDMGWSTTHVAAYVAFFCEAADMINTPDQFFFLNRRDLPLIPRDPRRHPYAAFGKPCRAPAPPPTLRAFSMYTGAGWKDTAIPEYAPWRAPPRVAWRNKTHGDGALFRGSSTGRGITAETNVRLALAKASRSPILDAGITAFSKRDKWSIDGNAVVQQPVIRAWMKAGIPLEEWGKWKILVYAEGHSAALRLGPMLGCGSVILWAVLPGYGTDAPRLWFWPPCITPAELLASSESNPVSKDVAMVGPCAVGEELFQTIRFLQAHDDIAQRLGCAALKLFDHLQSTRASFLTRVLATSSSSSSSSSASSSSASSSSASASYSSASASSSSASASYSSASASSSSTSASSSSASASSESFTPAPSLPKSPSFHEWSVMTDEERATWDTTTRESQNEMKATV